VPLTCPTITTDAVRMLMLARRTDSLLPSHPEDSDWRNTLQRTPTSHDTSSSQETGLQEILDRTFPPPPPTWVASSP
jgi:hypothetical protein